MELDFSPEQDAFRKVVRDFAEHEIAPHAEAWDRDHYFPVDTVKKMGELGLFGLPFPEEYGGSGADFSTLCIAIEELGRVDSSMAITLEAAVGLGASPIYKFGTEDQKAEWLPDMCAGRALGAFGLTEPDGGSDTHACRTRAMLDNAKGEWVINGAKSFITNSGTPITSVITVTARTDVHDISTIVVPAGSPGLIVEPAYRKMGWHASDTHGLSLQDCRVPAENLLGPRGAGIRQFLAVLDEGRVAISALATGLARACLEHGLTYAKDRRAFGGPIGRYQGIAFACADMAVMVENASNLTYKAAWLIDKGRPVTKAASLAKLYSSEAAVTCSRIATQIFGGYGFMDEAPVSRFYRDAKVLEIGEGTSEIQRLVISRHLGLPVIT
jgi:short-chain 2-methylacyl-CoA dehydrogenase